MAKVRRLKTRDRARKPLGLKMALLRPIRAMLHLLKLLESKPGSRL